MFSLSRVLFWAFLSASLAGAPAWAQTEEKKMVRPAAEASSPEDMVDITAQESLEWDKKTGLYYARGQAQAVAKGTTIEADLLTARQRDKGVSGAENGDIDQITAEGKVHLFDGKQEAFGDKAVYDVDTRFFRMTGQGLLFRSEGHVVKARDSFDFYDAENKAVARGQVVVEQEGNRISAEEMTAFFVRNAQGQRMIDKIVAKGDVVIATKDGGVARGKRAVYEARKETALLSDDVKITRGETQLSGRAAEVDFKSGKSRLLSGGEAGRVRVLLPASSGQKKKDGL